LNRQKIIQYLAPFTIVFIVLLFIYNIWSHGTIEHPGAASYKANCSQCHGDNGEGIKSLVPPLNQSDFAEKNIDSIPCWLKFGLSHPITVKGTVYDQPMYPFDTLRLNEVQIANIINYMNKEYFGRDNPVNSQWVIAHWKGCK
jgi:mono/diheme cytochrome c family protein